MTFEQTHAGFHSTLGAKELGACVFCAFCGVRVRCAEGGGKEGVVERPETGEVWDMSVDDDKSACWCRCGLVVVGELERERGLIELGSVFRWTRSRGSSQGGRVSVDKVVVGRDGSGRD